MSEVAGTPENVFGEVKEGFLGCKKRKVSKRDLLKEIYDLEFERATLLFNLQKNLEKEDFDEKQTLKQS